MNVSNSQKKKKGLKKYFSCCLLWVSAKFCAIELNAPTQWSVEAAVLCMRVSLKQRAPWYLCWTGKLFLLHCDVKSSLYCIDKIITSGQPRYGFIDSFYTTTTTTAAATNQAKQFWKIVSLPDFALQHCHCNLVCDYFFLVLFVCICLFFHTNISNKFISVIMGPD